MADPIIECVQEVTGCAAANAAIARFEDDLLHYRRSLPDLLDSAAVEGDCPLGDVLGAALHLMALTAQGRRSAAPLVERAQAAASRCTARERALIAAVAGWANGEATVAQRFVAIGQAWPDDLVVAKIAQFLLLNDGDTMGMLQASTSLLAARPHNRFVQGMHAFALEQNGDLIAAEKWGRQAVDAGPDPWAHHAIAHVLDSAGRASEGKAWMAQHAPSWDDCSSFMYTHNWWHAALFDISLGDHAGALALFDRRVWGVRRDCCQDQINAVSLLIRFEMLSVDVGARWEDLAPHLEQRIDDRANGFIDLHYAYGLARAGRDDAVEQQRRGLWRLVDHQPSALPLAVAIAADGMVAHARGDFAKAAACLLAARPATPSFGGSRTQRRLIDLVREDSHRRAALA
jgi:hypothetical protein